MPMLAKVNGITLTRLREASGARAAVVWRRTLLERRMIECPI